jgi:putative membrane fusion protein
MMPKPKKRTIYIFLLALVTLYIVIEIVPFLTGALTRTETLQYGELKVEEQVTCYLVRLETVYSAPEDGTLKYAVDEGTLIKRGSKVLRFTPSEDVTENNEKANVTSQFQYIMDRLGDRIVVDHDFTAVSRGIFSTYIDGFEATFTPERIESLKYSDVTNMKIKGEMLQRKKALEGEPLYKIADNSKWYIVFWIDNAAAAKYETGITVTVSLPGGEFLASVSRLVADEARFMVVLETNRYYKNFASEREVRGDILLEDRRGLLVSNTALTTRDGVVGVYVKNTIGEYVFKPVRTIATDGKQTLVLEDVYYDEEGLPVETVNVYDEILKKPEANLS